MNQNALLPEDGGSWILRNFDTLVPSNYSLNLETAGLSETFVPFNQTT